MTTTIVALFDRLNGDLPTDREVQLEFDPERRVVSMRGGPTGYESFYLDDYLKRPTRNGWTACAGTPGRWDRCFVPQAEMQRGLRALGAIS